MSLDVIFDSESAKIENIEEKVIQNEEMCTEESETIKYEGYVPEKNYFLDKKITELARSSWRAGYYLRGCVWSPDGTCCLTVVENDGMHLIEIQKDLILEHGDTNIVKNVTVLDSAVHVKEGGTVYDYCWFPGMNSGYPDTCWFVEVKYHQMM